MRRLIGERLCGRGRHKLKAFPPPSVNVGACERCGRVFRMNPAKPLEWPGA